MSAVHTTTTTPPATTARRSRESLLRWVAGGTGLATVLAVGAIALWPASETDKARDDGEQLGVAVSHLHDAQSMGEVDTALAEVDTAIADTRTHAGDALADQVDEQIDALARTADGFVGSRTSEDSFEADLYQAELDVALDDLTGNAGDFRAQGSEVQQAYWDGFESGVTS